MKYILHNLSSLKQSSDNCFYHEGSMASILEKTNRHFPTRSDYDGAKKTLLTLQKVYQLLVADMLAGTIRGRATDRLLSQQAAFEIASTAITNGDVTLSGSGTFPGIGNSRWRRWRNSLKTPVE